MTSWSGYGGPVYGHAAMRASDVDRDRAAEVLKSGFAAGRLTKDEYDDHLHWVYTARTYGDLVHVTRQLPGGGMALFRAPAPVVTGTSSLAVAALVCGAAEFVTFGLTAIPAVILGHMARGQIRRTGEHGSGPGLVGPDPGLGGDHPVRDRGRPGPRRRHAVMVRALPGISEGFLCNAPLPGASTPGRGTEGNAARAGEVSGPARAWWTARPRRLPAALRPARWSSSASCLPSAVPAACACG